MQYDSLYVETNLIAYIGNKRRLLPLITQAIEKTGAVKEGRTATFCDLFSGSGVVGRLAKSMGMAVTVNDWEYYSYVINKAFIGLNRSFLRSSFKNLGGLGAVLAQLNSLREPSKSDRYIATYYCPEDDNAPDLEKERMFYTSYNGKKIDAIRGQIASWFENGKINRKEQYLLLALLLYEASTRSNTSGVFKGFHRGFGGTNGDALTRIMKEVELAWPELIDGPTATVYQEDAMVLAQKLRNNHFDIVYLDPPYNQHQYGSNYHLLNTIALNDKPGINRSIIMGGKKTNKSAIRRDWIKTRSTFCYRSSASQDFRELINMVNADHILISYSTDGIIPFDEMLEILSSKGQVNICTSEYVKFRGGKQALTSEVRNVEFVLMVDTTKQGSKSQVTRISKRLLLDKIDTTIKKTVNAMNAELAGFDFKTIKRSKVLVKSYGNRSVTFVIRKNHVENLEEVMIQLQALPYSSLKTVYHDLQVITDLTREDELYMNINDIVRLYREKKWEDALESFRQIPYLLSKFNNRKAYIPSLKAIISTLSVLLQTMEVWTANRLIDERAFSQLEKIILTKINHRSDPDRAIDSYKEQITSLYDYLIGSLEGENQQEEQAVTISDRKKA
jgi:adenine-specific DNA methylase